MEKCCCCCSLGCNVCEDEVPESRTSVLGLVTSSATRLFTQIYATISSIFMQYAYLMINT